MSLNSLAICDVRQYTTKSASVFTSRTMELCIALMNWMALPELWDITSLGLSLKDKSDKQKSHSILEGSALPVLISYGWLAARVLKANEAQLVNNVSLVLHHYFIIKCGCYYTVKICNWFVYWTILMLLHGQLTYTWKMVQTESNTPKWYLKFLLKLQKLWEAFTI